MSKTHEISSKNGFTLLELLVASGVIGLVSVIIAQILFSSVRINAKTELLKELKQTGAQTMDGIERMIQNAIIVTASPCNESADDPKITTSQLTLIGFDGGETILQCIDDSEHGIARIASVSASRAEPVYLTGSGLTLLGMDGEAQCSSIPLQFTCIKQGDVPTSVSIFFRMRQKNLSGVSYENAFENFQSTVSIRNNSNQ